MPHGRRELPSTVPAVYAAKPPGIPIHRKPPVLFLSGSTCWDQLSILEIVGAGRPVSLGGGDCGPPRWRAERLKSRRKKNLAARKAPLWAGLELRGRGVGLSRLLTHLISFSSAD
jgi:hypothetical protein